MLVLGGREDVGSLMTPTQLTGKSLKDSNSIQVCPHLRLVVRGEGGGMENC